MLSVLALATVSSTATASATPFAEGTLVDRVVVNPGEDAATTMAVTFRGLGTDGAVEVDAPYAEPRVVPATSVLRHGQPPALAEMGMLGRTGEHFSAVLGGLQPETTYRYRPVVDGNPGEWAEFTTASAAPDPFSFLYFGDAQTHLTDVWPKVTAHALEHSPDADLSIHAGDQIDLPNLDHEWADFFSGMHGTMASRPSITAAGNHEIMTGPMLREHRAHFEFPYNGHPDFPESTFYVDYQDVRFITLHANYMGLEEQTRWLDRTLAENPKQWAVVMFHHPVWSVAEGRGDGAHNDAYRSTLEHHDVDLVLTGHDHGYGRGHAVERDGGTPGQHDGPVYVTSVAGGKYYDVNMHGDPWRQSGGVRERIAGGLSTFQRVDVDGCRIDYTSIVGHASEEATLPLTEGDVLDEFSIDKCGGEKLVTY